MNWFLILPIIMLIILFLINYFIVFRIYYLVKEKSYKKSFFISFGIFIFIILSMILSTFLGFRTNLSLVSYYFVVIFVLFFICLIYWFIFSFKKLKSKKNLQLVLIILTLVLYVLFGIYNANTFVVKEINLSSNKVSNPVNFIQISDSHIGSESPRYFEKIINQIKSMDKDFIVITGDLIDEDRITQDDLSSLKTLDVPVYFIYGNHETYTRKKIDFFENLSLIVLDNQKVMFNNEIDIIGINIYDNNSRGFNNDFEVRTVLDKVNVNNSKYNIILNHEPVGLKDVSERQIDLQLSGHTHNGQLWPLNYVVKAIYGYNYGLYNISESTKLYVSSGVGVWGPNLRTSARNEIIKFNIK